jgi:hypothetical protein
MTALTENHQHVLESRLRSIDNLLRELERRVQPVCPESVFEDEISDWTDEKRRIVFDWIAEVRALMKSIMERKGIEAAPSTAGAAWLLRSSADVMLSVVDELRPERMRGYGELSADASRELDEIVSALRQVLSEAKKAFC